MSATYSSLQNFNTPLGSRRGQTDVTVTFLCCFQHLWTLHQQKSINRLYNHRKHQGRRMDLELDYLFNISILLINYCMLAIEEIPVQGHIIDSTHSEKWKQQT